jgi:hypothetical protein
MPSDSGRRHVVILAPMPLEMHAIVPAFGLSRTRIRTDVSSRIDATHTHHEVLPTDGVLKCLLPIRAAAESTPQPL